MADLAPQGRPDPPLRLPLRPAPKEAGLFVDYARALSRKDLRHGDANAGKQWLTIDDIRLTHVSP